MRKPGPCHVGPKTKPPSLAASASAAPRLVTVKNGLIACSSRGDGGEHAHIEQSLIEAGDHVELLRVNQHASA
jgi:hypothetical protein